MQSLQSSVVGIDVHEAEAVKVKCSPLVICTFLNSRFNSRFHASYNLLPLDIPRIIIFVGLCRPVERVEEFLK